MCVQIANLYNKNHELAGDVLLAPLRRLQRVWNNITFITPLDSCDEVIVKLVKGVFLIIPTLIAYILGAVGVACKAVSFTSSVFCAEVDVVKATRLFSEEPIKVRAFLTSPFLLERHLNGMAPRMERLFAELFNDWLPVVEFQVVSRGEGRGDVRYSVRTYSSENSGQYPYRCHINQDEDMVFDLTEQQVWTKFLLTRGIREN